MLFHYHVFCSLVLLAFLVTIQPNGVEAGNKEEDTIIIHGHHGCPELVMKHGGKKKGDTLIMHHCGHEEHHDHHHHHHQKHEHHNDHHHDHHGHHDHHHGHEHHSEPEYLRGEISQNTIA